MTTEGPDPRGDDLDEAEGGRDDPDPGMQWWWLFYSPIALLIAIGWAVWAVGVVLLVYCEGLQSGMLASPGDPCAGLRWGVIGGLVFMLVTSFLALNSWSKRRG
jgi:hypothetical protein